MQVIFPNFNQNQAPFLAISVKRHRSCCPCDVYKVRSIWFKRELVASLQFPRSIETTKFEVNFYVERQYNSFLPLLPIWKLALNVLAIDVFACLFLEIADQNHNIHVGFLLPLILDTGGTLLSNAGECIQTTYDRLHCTSMASWMFNLIVWTDHHSTLWKRHIHNYWSRFYSFVLDPGRLGKIKILNVVFWDCLELAWSKWQVYFCRIGKVYPKQKYSCITHTMYVVQILTVKIRTQLALEASCLACLFYSIP